MAGNDLLFNLSLNQTRFLKTEISFFRNNQMIEHPKSENFPGFGQPVMQTQIRFAGIQFTGGMIMNKDHSGRTIGDGVRKYFPWMDRCVFQKTDGYNPFLNNLVGSIQGDADKVLLLFSGNIGRQGQNILSNRYFNSFLVQMPTSEFKGREDPRGFGQAHTGNSEQLIKSQLVLMFLDQFGHIQGHSAHIDARGPRTKDGRHQLLIGQCADTFFFQFFPRAAMFG